MQQLEKNCLKNVTFEANRQQKATKIFVSKVGY